MRIVCFDPCDSGDRQKDHFAAFQRTIRSVRKCTDSRMTSSAELVLFDLDASTGVATITLNRPAQCNAFNSEMIAPLASCLVVTGSGNAFSAGGDYASASAPFTRPLARACHCTRTSMPSRPAFAASLGHAVAALSAIRPGTGAQQHRSRREVELAPV